MHKSLYDYKWFKFYSESGIGIKVRGKTFYPTKRPVRSCKNCYFFNKKYTLDGQYISNRLTFSNFLKGKRYEG